MRTGRLAFSGAGEKKVLGAGASALARERGRVRVYPEPLSCPE